MLELALATSSGNRTKPTSTCFCSAVKFMRTPGIGIIRKPGIIGAGMIVAFADA